MRFNLFDRIAIQFEGTPSLNIHSLWLNFILFGLSKFSSRNDTNMFELTVLFAAYGMVFTFFYVNHLFPGRAPRVMDLRATNDRFVIAIDASLNDINSVDAVLKEAGAIEIKHNERKYISYDEE